MFFGLVRIFPAGSTATTERLRTNYMAPEMFEGKAYTGKVDVFSFAMCAFAILAKQEPFAALAKQALFGMCVIIANAIREG